MNSRLTDFVCLFVFYEKCVNEWCFLIRGWKRSTRWAVWERANSLSKTKNQLSGKMLIFSLFFFFISLGLGGKRPQPPASCGRSQGVSQSGGILQHVLDLLELSQLDVPGILTGRCPESILTKCLKHLNWFLSTCRFSYTQTSLVLRVHSDTVGRKFILAVAAMVSEGYKRMK